MKDPSNREPEGHLTENLSANRFDRFRLSKSTPNYRLFTRVCSRIGPTRLTRLLEMIRAQVTVAGLVSDMFTFVDATHLLAIVTRWKERNKDRQQKIAKLNNEVLQKLAVDQQDRIGWHDQER